MKILILTWNTNNERELPEIKHKADMIIIGLQECFTSPEITKIKKKYAFITQVKMFGIQTIVASKKEYNIRFYKLGMGPLGFLNKGVVVAVINDCIAHLNVHLTAHSCNVDKRLDQLHQILSFSHINKDLIILAGDMNFREQQEAISFKRHYPMFREQLIEFKPTYKYLKSKIDKTRMPAYCDRIMYASNIQVKIHEYDSMSYIDTSDHKPVYCFMEVENTVALTTKTSLSDLKSLLFQRIRTETFLFVLNYIYVISLMFFFVLLYFLN